MLVISCQKTDAPVQENKGTQATQENKSVVATSAMTVARSEQKSGQSELLQNNSKDVSEIIKSPLTQKEQEEFELIGGAMPSPNYNLFMKDWRYAERHLKILLKGNEKTIRWYVKEKTVGDLKDVNIKDVYADDICTTLDAIPQKEIKPYLYEIVEKKKDYPRALACAAKHFRLIDDRVSVPVLHELIKHEDVTVRLEAGTALLAFDDADIALPVLEEVTKEGATTALGNIFHSLKGKSWEQKGIESIKKAFEYENKESRALAALFLLSLKEAGMVDIEAKKIEDTFVEIAEKILAKEKWPLVAEGYSDHRALDTVIIGLRELRDKKAIPLLKRIKEHPDASFLENHAEEAINIILYGRQG